ELPLPLAPELVELRPRRVGDRAGRPVGRQVRREPRAHLGAEPLLLRRQREVHRPPQGESVTPVYAMPAARRDEPRREVPGAARGDRAAPPGPGATLKRRPRPLYWPLVDTPRPLWPVVVAVQLGVLLAALDATI